MKKGKSSFNWEKLIDASSEMHSRRECFDPSIPFLRMGQVSPAPPCNYKKYSRRSDLSNFCWSVVRLILPETHWKNTSSGRIRKKAGYMSNEVFREKFDVCLLLFPPKIFS